VTTALTTDSCLVTTGWPVAGDGYCAAADGTSHPCPSPVRWARRKLWAFRFCTCK